MPAIYANSLIRRRSLNADHDKQMEAGQLSPISFLSFTFHFVFCFLCSKEIGILFYTLIGNLYWLSLFLIEIMVVGFSS